MKFLAYLAGALTAALCVLGMVWAAGDPRETVYPVTPRRLRAVSGEMAVTG